MAEGRGVGPLLQTGPPAERRGAEHPHRDTDPPLKVILLLQKVNLQELPVTDVPFARWFTHMGVDEILDSPMTKLFHRLQSIRLPVLLSIPPPSLRIQGLCRGLPSTLSSLLTCL